MTELIFNDRTGAFVKFVCIGCGIIEPKSCNNLNAFKKFINLKIDTKGCCRACGSSKILFKDGLGRHFKIE